MDFELIMEIVMALIAIFVAMVVYALVPYIKSRTSAEQYQKIQWMVHVAVMAAEQMFKLPGLGAEKKSYVLKMLRKNGVRVSDDELELLIESAVHQLNQALVKITEE